MAKDDCVPVFLFKDVRSLNKFLGCVELETFGIYFGWFNLVAAMVMVVFYFLIAIKCLIEQDWRYLMFVFEASLICGLIAWISGALIQGSKTRNPKKVRWFRMLCIVVTVLLVLQIAQKLYFGLYRYLSHNDLMMSLIHITVAGYVTICIHSLYIKLEREEHPQTKSPVLTPSTDVTEELKPEILVAK